MNPVRGLLYIMTVSMVIGGWLACTHSKGDGRGLASDPARACEELRSDEKAELPRLVAIRRGINEALKNLGELAHLTQAGLEPFQGGRFDSDQLLPRHNGIFFSKAQVFAKILLGDCGLVREGFDPSPSVTRHQTPELFQRVRKLCGYHDLRLAPYHRAHPESPRTWDDFEVDTMNTDIRAWVLKANSLVDYSLAQLVSPERATEVCTQFNMAANVEDQIEKLFLCLEAYRINLYEYDEEHQRYVVDAGGEHIMRPREGLVRLGACAQACAEENTKGCPR